VRAAAVLLSAATAAALSGCAPTIDLAPAAHAGDPRCADVTVRLPDTVAGLAKRETNAQATGAWGDPAAVLLRCGVADPGPTTLPCVTALGIDWVVDASDQKAISYTTFGRDPAIQVVVNHKAVSDSTVLADLKPAVTVIPQKHKCLDTSDTFTTPAPNTTPAPSTTPAP